MEISLHSNQKHSALSYYLKIIADLIKSPKNPFNKLYYVDLYCGDGKCRIKKTKEDYSPPIIDSILKVSKENNFPVCCFLNDLDPKKIGNMKKNTLQYKDLVESYSCEDANICYKKILKKIPPDQFCIFFLDPTNHKDLKWKTIEKISKHTHKYLGLTRRPELLINFMIFTLVGSYMAKDFKSINESLGTDSWIKLIEKYKDEGVQTPVIKAFLDTFINQLKNLGYDVPPPIKIKGIRASNIIYYLIWATNKKGCDIIEKKVFPYLSKTILKKHKSNKIALIKAEAREKGDSSLEKWF